ncbi:hypothetical protein [Streptomyces sp. NPDC000618]|uniref:hypothetical protein n=1 Tax=Streptomyces sp. NPDC000618 TaxID=3154265 RepID=UPI0033227298
MAAVVDLGDPADDAVGDPGGPPALDDLVVEVGLAQFPGRHAEFEDLLDEAAVLDGGDRAVAGHAEVGALEHAEAVAAHTVVVVRAGLGNLVVQRSLGSVQHVPVAQRVRGAVGLVEDDRADGARRRPNRPGQADAHAGLDRVQAGLAGRALDLGHGAEVRLVAALDDVGGHLDAVHRDGLGDRGRAQSLQGLRLGLAGHRELQHDLLTPLAGRDLAADAHGRDVRILQQFRAPGADIATQGTDQTSFSSEKPFFFDGEVVFLDLVAMTDCPFANGDGVRAELREPG